MASDLRLVLRFVGYLIVIIINVVVSGPRLLRKIMALRLTGLWSRTKDDSATKGVGAKQRRHDKAVEAEIMNVQIIAIRGGLRFLAGFCVLFSVFPTINTFLRTGKEPFQNPSQDIVSFLLMLWWSVLNGFPAAFFLRPSVFTASVYLGLTVFLCVSDTTAHNFRLYDTSAVLARFSISLLSPSTVTTLIGNGLMSVAFCTAVVRGGGAITVSVLNNEIALCFFGVQFTRVFSQGLRSHVVNLITVRTLRGEAAASTALLNVVCDAVVDLDCDLCIDCESARFKGMLALAPQSSQKGKPFASFLASDQERACVKDHFGGLSMDEDGFKSGAVHTAIRDGRGVKLDVDLFYVMFEDATGRQRFILGIREALDQTEARDLSLDNVSLTFTATGNPHGAPRGQGARGKPKTRSSSGSKGRAAASAPSPPTPSHAVGSSFVDAAAVGALAPDRSQHDSEGQCEPRTCDGALMAAVAKAHTLLDQRRQRRLGGDEGSARGSLSSSSRSSGSSRPARFEPMVPALAVTARWALELSLLQACESWNCRWDATRCCRFHSALEVARVTLKRLAEMECHHGTWPIGDKQCNKCGMLSCEDHPCKVCGMANDKSEPSASTTERVVVQL